MSWMAGYIEVGWHPTERALGSATEECLRITEPEELLGDGHGVLSPEI